jgi:hypothetical protein
MESLFYDTWTSILTFLVRKLQEFKTIFETYHTLSEVNEELIPKITEKNVSRYLVPVSTAYPVCLQG